MKKTICLILLLVSVFGLFSCKEENEVPSNYPKEVETSLEGDDYVDHQSTYDGKKLSYDKSKWYVNELTEVPLPDPQVYEEDGE